MDWLKDRAQRNLDVHLQKDLKRIDVSIKQFSIKHQKNTDTVVKELQKIKKCKRRSSLIDLDNWDRKRRAKPHQDSVTTTVPSTTDDVVFHDILRSLNSKLLETTDASETIYLPVLTARDTKSSCPKVHTMDLVDYLSDDDTEDEDMCTEYKLPFINTLFTTSKVQIEEPKPSKWKMLSNVILASKTSQDVKRRHSLPTLTKQKSAASSPIRLPWQQTELKLSSRRRSFAGVNINGSSIRCISLGTKETPLKRWQNLKLKESQRIREQYQVEESKTPKRASGDFVKMFIDMLITKRGETAEKYNLKYLKKCRYLRLPTTDED